MQIAHDLALQLAAPAGLVIVADYQAAGRGRRERSWQAPLGQGLLVSIILADSLLPEEPLQIPMLGALALVQAVVAEPGLPPEAIGLKWPNDLVDVRSYPPRKLAGVLVESGASGRALTYAVLGFGVNVHQSAAELPSSRPGGLEAASLVSAFGIRCERTQLLIRLSRALAELSELPREALHARWDHLLVGKQGLISVGEGDSAWSARFRETTVDGALLVEDESGEIRRVDLDPVHFAW